jgi:TatD DNase family protein
LKYEIKKAVVHGFIGSAEQAKIAVTNGFFLSFGFTTERSPKTIAALDITPLENLFAETDTSSRKIEEAYEMICRLKGCSMQELQSAIEQNYKKLFSIQ